MEQEALTVLRTPTFERWLHKLKDRQGQITILARLLRLQKGQWGDCKNLGEGLFELRVGYEPGYRVYVAKFGTRVVLLLCGGDKGTQHRDIEKARRLIIQVREERTDL